MYPPFNEKLKFPASNPIFKLLLKFPRFSSLTPFKLIFVFVFTNLASLMLSSIFPNSYSYPSPKEALKIEKLVENIEKRRMKLCRYQADLR